MVKVKEEISYFALLIENWSTFYSFGINRMNPKLKSDMDYKYYDRSKSLELICKAYQNEIYNKLLSNETVIVHMFPKSETSLIEGHYQYIGGLELNKKYGNKVYIEVPEKDFHYLITALQYKKNSAISITHKEVKRNKTPILSFDIMTDFDPKEF